MHLNSNSQSMMMMIKMSQNGCKRITILRMAMNSRMESKWMAIKWIKIR